MASKQESNELDLIIPHRKKTRGEGVLHSLPPSRVRGRPLPPSQSRKWRVGSSVASIPLQCRISDRDRICTIPTQAAALIRTSKFEVGRADAKPPQGQTDGRGRGRKGRPTCVNR